ncbi:MAG: DUF2252 domain-containing protein [Candidatus Cybelea sp.]
MDSLRKRLPRSRFGEWQPSPGRDPVALLAEQEKSRLLELIALRHERMAASAFAFYRGSAVVMAADLASLPVTGITVQACGDAHIANFGFFATPERRVVYDLNDFDETLPGPWEWDVLRLAASIALAARARSFPANAEHQSVLAGVRAYREAMAYFTTLSPLEVFYQRVDVKRVIRETPLHRRVLRRIFDRARRRTAQRALPKLTRGSPPQFVDQPPTFRRLRMDEEGGQIAREAHARYLETLPAHVRMLRDRYKLHDVALKVVGVGSVGTACFVSLSLTDQGESLLLQIKEAQASVLEGYTKPSEFTNHGERVVIGQRILQAAADIFLGWFTLGGRDYYVRQLRDMKTSANLDIVTAPQLEFMAEYCGWTLARGHARSGDPHAIAAYLGSSERFDLSAARFAQTYANLAEADHARYVEAPKLSLRVIDRSLSDVGTSS